MARKSGCAFGDVQLRPSVLERFPQMDRHKCDFPADLQEYFFDVDETFVTR